MASATWSAGEARGRGPKPRRSLRAEERAWSKRSTSISMSWLDIVFVLFFLDHFWGRFSLAFWIVLLMQKRELE